jgi:hypothetical protein
MKKFKNPINSIRGPNGYEVGKLPDLTLLTRHKYNKLSDPTPLDSTICRA